MELLFKSLNTKQINLSKFVKIGSIIVNDHVQGDCFYQEAVLFHKVPISEAVAIITGIISFWFVQLICHFSISNKKKKLNVMQDSGLHDVLR